MPRDVAEVQRELEKIVPVLGSTEEADRIARQMLLTELRILIEELEQPD